jgi:hypothetical protein
MRRNSMLAVGIATVAGILVVAIALAGSPFEAAP